MFAASLLLLVSCTGAPAPATPDDPEWDHVPGEGDSAEDTDTDSGTHTGDSESPPLQLGDPCEPGVSDCGEGNGCCTACCSASETPECTALDSEGACPLPDLTMDPAALAEALDVQDMPFEEGTCAMAEACVDAAGWRRLLKFTTTVPNTGTADLAFGDVRGDDRFHYDECHEHLHMDAFAEYALLAADGTEIAAGRKQAFCMMDNTDWGAGTGARYTCDFQGISVGWADTYAAWLDCQWIDITEVNPGDYTLRVTVNAGLLIAESNYDNNVTELPVTIPARDAVPPITEACATLAYGEYRECDWEAAGDFSCTPGTTVEVGCDAGCLGDCVGDPILRVCDGLSPQCASVDALANTDRAECGSWCPRVEVVCPDSGTLSALVGPWTSGEEAACAVVVTEL
jgi:hypothetical protein